VNCELRTVNLLICCSLFLSTPLFGWTDGQLLVWTDGDRAQAIRDIAKNFEAKWGIKVAVESPPNLTDNFVISAEAGKGPDIVIWAHDKVGEWADAGLIAPVDLDPAFARQLFPQFRQAVGHRNATWGYPIALETVTLIYNRKLIPGPPPGSLAEIEAMDQTIRSTHTDIRTICWNYRSPYYSWGILASGGAYVFKRRGVDYDLKDIGIAVAGSVEALSGIIDLVHQGILPPGPVSNEGETLMAQGKLAMTISGPWSWSNFTQNGIDFGLAQVPGIDGRPGRPFVGVSVAYLNQSSPNKDAAKQFLEQNLITLDGLMAMNHAKPIGIPALMSAYEKMAAKDSRLRELKAVVDQGEIMPNIPKMGRFFSALGGAMETAINGQVSPEQALQQAAEEIRGH
jgi:maltose/maltodextrin transport system substrate-binding protein